MMVEEDLRVDFGEILKCNLHEMKISKNVSFLFNG